MAKKNRKRPSQFQNPLLSNASKTLFANIRFVSIDEKVKTIVVASTGMDEGKTPVVGARIARLRLYCSHIRLAPVTGYAPAARESR